MSKEDIYLIKERVNKFYLILPFNADFYEEYAGKEFAALYEMATGIKMLVERDNREYFLDAKPLKNMVSIGDTEFFKRSGITIDREKLTRDGFKVVIKDNVIYLNGGGGYGKINAVYEFFRIFFGYKYYASDEIRIEKDVIFKKIHDIDVEGIPDFKNRGNGFYYGRRDECAVRMRTLTDYSRMIDGCEVWGLFGHTQQKVLIPVEKYFFRHPDWFYGQYQEQLCLTNDEMIEELTANLIGKIKETPNSKYYMIGHVDSKTFCNCRECAKQTEEVGRSGIMMRFINKVARKVKAWQNENCPERDITLGVFAYEVTEDPPVKKIGGEYKLLAADLKAEDNVMIILALINADYSKPLNDEKYNGKDFERVKGWQAVTDRFGVWSYFGNFSRGVSYFDGVDAIAPNMKFFKSINAEWVFVDTLLEKNGIIFQPLYCYLHANLLWDTTLDVWDLIKEFITAYYDDDKGYMYEYYKYIYDTFKKNKAEHIEKGNGYFMPQLVGFFEMVDYKNEFKDGFWKYGQVEEMKRIIDKALYANEHSGKSDERKKTVRDRIRLEAMFTDYLILELFDKEVGAENFCKLLDDFMLRIDEFGLKNTRLVKCRPINITYTIWKNRALGIKDFLSERK